MMLVELTTVPQGALPVAQLKDHLRLGSGFADASLDGGVDGDAQDALIAGFLRAALAAVEGRTGKALIEREFRWTLPGWRGAGQAVTLPVAPVSAIASVAILDAGGAETEVPAALWRLIPDGHAPQLAAPGTLLPSVPQGGMARVDFLAGYGPEFNDLPADLQQAVILLAGHYFDYRHDTALGSGCMPFGVTALTERYRIMRLGGRA